ncbi:hypothetical protein PAPYR_12239 [Paratrimastix pyriformis]|uniref:Uncharacterized protein n=1 Tax=Paratrimastix pyriformis TaxID=342808 RepID=A0ABQ8U495_9EUKA|nr:hypothetical protein PAPYR_13195 [Paratrimastix pyriformis]KAJ4453317.1 hypothetical protein PAPYR_12239 [Paratrimastix pyriformis]
MMCYDAIKLSHGENQSNLNLPNQNYYKKLMIFRQNKVGVPAPLLYDIVNNGIQITDPVYIQGNGFTDILKNVWNWFKPRSESIIAAAKEVIPKAVNFGKKVYESYKKKKGDPHDLFQEGTALTTDALKKISELAQKDKEIREAERQQKSLEEKQKSEIIRQQLISAHEDNQEQQQISNRAAQDRAKSDIEAVQAVIRHRKVGNGKKKTRKRRTRGRGLKEF